MNLSRCFLPCFLVYTILKDFARGFSEAKQFDDSDTAGFDDFVHTVRGAMHALFDYAGNEDGCFYRCSNGGRPITNPKHNPSSNGCGSFGIMLDMKDFPAVEDCCHLHDICYDTCNSQKDDCDNAFRHCLTKICIAMKNYMSPDIYNGCRSTADIMYAGTMALGCKPYKDSQKNACMCHPRTEL